MIDFTFLPMMREQDVEVDQEYKVYSVQSAPRKDIVPANELGTREKNELKLLQSSTLRATMTVNELEDVIMTDEDTAEGQCQSECSGDTPEFQITSSRVLRSANKRQEKTVETEKRKCKVNEARAVNCIEDPANVDDRLQSELKDTKDKLATLKKDLKNTKSQLTGMRRVLASCRRDLKESKGWSNDLKRANKDLQEDLKASQEELVKCRDDMFSLQKVAQVPDSTISNRFESIGQQIAHWIDAAVAEFEKAHPEADPDLLFTVGQNRGATEFLRRHPSAGEHLTRFLIHRFLYDNVFVKRGYLFGLPEETAQLLQAAELAMAELDPPRDSVAIASWRSETLQALAKSSKYKEYFQQRSQNLNSHMFKHLSKTLPNIFTGPQAHATFFEQVIVPAIKLANLIRMSSSDYVFSITQSPLTEFKPVAKDMLKVHKMVDSRSGRQLTPDSAIVIDEDGTFGKLIICLEPGLYRQSKGKETTLQQEMFLVELHHPLPKRVKTSV